MDNGKWKIKKNNYPFSIFISSAALFPFFIAEEI